MTSWEMAMTQRARWGLIATGAFGAVNAAGTVMATLAHESMHAGIHAALTLLSAIVGYVILRGVRRAVAPMPALASAPLDGRLDHLERSIEQLAVGIERVGEGQRFMTHAVERDPEATDAKP